MHVQTRASKYESMQLLLTIVLGFVHVAVYVLMFWAFLSMGAPFILIGFVFGALEMALTRTMSDTLAVLRFWLLAAGAITMAFSASCLLYLLSSLA